MLIYRDPETDAVLAVYPGSDPDALTGVSAYSHVDGDFVWRLGSPASGALPHTLKQWIETEAPGFATLPDDIAALIEAAGFAP